MALIALEAAMKQPQPLLEAAKGTPLEPIVQAGGEQAELLKAALEEGDLKRAKILADAMNRMGAQSMKTLQAMRRDAAALNRHGDGLAPATQPAGKVD
ncbi:MAG: hypothetical protein WEC36_10375 [Phycisphaeraceae bacterium]